MSWLATSHSETMLHLFQDRNRSIRWNKITIFNDRDRHHGQWRWARFPNGKNYTWVPIPEDRDLAFVDLDGFALALLYCPL